MRAPALPCEQKAGEEEGRGKGKKQDVENCGRTAKSFRKKVIWNLSLEEINSLVGQEFGGRVSCDKIELMQHLLWV